jgi:hypothetical protein
LKICTENPILRTITGRSISTGEKFSGGILRFRKMAGVAGLEPVTSAVTGQRSNQLSYTPAKGDETIKKVSPIVKFWFG